MQDNFLIHGAEERIPAESVPRNMFSPQACIILYSNAVIQISILVLVLQARIVGVNAAFFLKNGGFFVISIKASCIDSTAPPEAVFAREVKKLQELQLKPKEQASHCHFIALTYWMVSP